MTKLTNIILKATLLELIFGFNGTLIIIGGVSIRNILFLSSCIILGIELLNLIKKIGVKQVYLMYTKLDKVLCAFLLLILFWIFPVPIVNGSSVPLAIKETVCVSIMVLYFLLVPRLKDRGFWENMYRFILNATMVLAVMYMVLFICELHIPNRNFVIEYFELFKKVPFTESVRPMVLYPIDFVRLIFPNSVFFFLLFYHMAKEDFSKSGLVYGAIGSLAFLTTITKSLIFAVVICLALYSVLFLITSKDYKVKEKFRRVLISLVIVGLTLIIGDQLILDNYFMERVANSLVIQSEGEVYERPVNNGPGNPGEIINARTKEANSIRLVQTRYLIDKWKGRPVLGFGFGSYAEGYIRGGKETPYSYEMFLPALLMKIGLLGMLVIACFTVWLIRYISLRDEMDLFWQFKPLFILLCIIISTQFNPYLLNSSGILLVLVAFIELRQNGDIAFEKMND